MDRFRRFASLPSDDRRLLLAALAVVASVRIALWVLPFGSLRSAIERVKRPHRFPSIARPDADRIAWAVAVTAGYIPGATCLTRAIAGEVLLSRAGLPAELRIGVATDGYRKLEAHAWIESGGRVVLGDHDLHRFTPLAPSTHA